MTDSQTLVAEYVRTGSEPAFRELVERYLGLVYSSALRLVGGDTQFAEDVSQMVFLHLARKAHRLPREVMLGGWLPHELADALVQSALGYQIRASTILDADALIAD